MCSALPKLARDLGTTQRRLLGDLSSLTPLSAAERVEQFCAPPTGSVERRWHVYTSGYFVRLRDALALDYRAIARIAGEEAFSGLVGRYLMACPPRRYDLAMAGERFPSFVVSDSIAGELPFAPDLAQLERAVSDGFVAADLPAASWDQLRTMPAADAAEIQLRLRPSTTVIRSEWPLRELWLTAFDSDDESIDVDLSAKPRCFLVHRNDGEMFVREIDDDLATLLRAAGPTGNTLAELAGALSLGLEPDDVRHFLVLLQRALALSLFTLTSVATHVSDTRLTEDR